MDGLTPVKEWGITTVPEEFLKECSLVVSPTPGFQGETMKINLKVLHKPSRHVARDGFVVSTNVEVKDYASRVRRFGIGLFEDLYELVTHGVA